MPHKTYSSKKSFVISIKLPLPEFQLINQYLVHEKVSFAEFIRTIVDQFIQMENLQEYGNRPLISQLMKHPRNQEVYAEILESDTEEEYDDSEVSKEKLSLRIKKPTLRMWDEYCEKHFFTRTGLIRAALFEFFHSPEHHIVPSPAQLIRIRQLLEALFSGLGAIEERRIMALFHHYDSAVIYDALTQLESEGKVGRKVSESNRVIFVPTGLIDDTGEQPLLARLLERLI